MAPPIDGRDYESEPLSFNEGLIRAQKLMHEQLHELLAYVRQVAKNPNPTDSLIQTHDLMAIRCPRTDEEYRIGYMSVLRENITRAIKLTLAFSPTIGTMLGIQADPVHQTSLLVAAMFAERQGRYGYKVQNRCNWLKMAITKWGQWHQYRKCVGAPHYPRFTPDQVERIKQEHHLYGMMVRIVESVFRKFDAEPVCDSEERSADVFQLFIESYRALLRLKMDQKQGPAVKPLNAMLGALNNWVFFGQW